MKTLLLIRHGKSDWSANLSDRERPLNQRGISDAPIMANVLKLKQYIPDIIYYSSAKRTTQTTQLLADNLDLSKEILIRCPELYLCYPEVILETIEITPNEHNTIAIVGHNPSISQVVNHLCGKHNIELPTLGCAIFTFNCDNWLDAAPYLLDSYQIFYPKMFKM